MKQAKIFQKIVILIFSLFMGLMVLVTVLAYSKKTGHTGMDMGKLQQLRYQQASNTK